MGKLLNSGSQGRQVKGRWLKKRYWASRVARDSRRGDFAQQASVSRQQAEPGASGIAACYSAYDKERKQKCSKQPQLNGAGATRRDSLSR